MWRCSIKYTEEMKLAKYIILCHQRNSKGLPGILPWINFCAGRVLQLLQSQQHLATISIMKTPLKVFSAGPCSYRPKRDR